MLITMILVIALIALLYWLRLSERKRIATVTSIFYRKYRVQDYNGSGRDLVITHEQLRVHPDLSQYENQFLFILFGEESDVVLNEPDRFGRITLRARVESQSADSEQAIADHLERIERK